MSQWWTRKISAAIALAMIAMMVLPWAALADEVKNNVTAGGSDTITAGGVTTIGYKIVNVTIQGGDTQNNCNPADRTSATLTIAVPADVTASTSQLVFTSCDTYQNITFTSSKAGSYPVTVSVADSGTGTYDTTGAKWTLKVNAPTAPADTTAPTLNLPAGIVAEAAGANGAAVTYTTSAADTNPASPTVTCDKVSGSTFPLGTTTVSCSAKDAAGNTANGSFNIIVKDTTAPTLTLPNDMTAEATSANGTAMTYTAPSATDAVTSNPAVSCDKVSDSTFPLGTTTVSCSTTDAAGNPASGSFKVTVEDTTKPVVGMIADVTAEATGSDGAIVTYTTTGATDAVTSNPAVNCDKASGSTFPMGTTTVNCSATDAAGNVGTQAFKIAVSDTAKPVLVVPADVTVEATSADGAIVTYSASASDVVDGTVAVSCTAASKSTFALGTTTVNCSAKDGAGNTANGSFNVIVEDTIKPTLSLPGSAAVEATSAAGAVVAFEAPTATDVVSGDVAVNCDKASEATFALGTTTVNCSATDAAGNTAEGSFSVIVKDTIAPVLALPAPDPVEATGANGAAVSYLASAIDAVSGDVAVNCDKASEATFALSTTTVNCSATDAAGNTAEGSFSITVVDTTKPLFGTTTDVTEEATSADGATVNFSNPTATDIVDGNVTVSCDPASGSAFALGTSAVNCSATDKTGNTATKSFNVIVKDTTAPVLNLPTVNAAEATGPSGATVTFDAPSATDTVDSTVVVSCDKASGLFPIGETTVNCSAKDAAGNTANGSFNVTVVDTTAPTISVNSAITDGASYYFADVPQAPTCSATDLVSGSISCTVSGYNTAIGKHTVSFTAKDAAGNTATTTLGYTVMGWTFKGFYQPVDMGGALNSVKGGSTVPLKFEVFKGTTEVTSTSSIVQPLKAVKVSCSTNTVIDEIELLASGSTALRYDTVEGQFIYNWKTPTGSNCYAVTVAAADGSSQTAYFKTR